MKIVKFSSVLVIIAALVSSFTSNPKTVLVPSVLDINFLDETISVSDVQKITETDTIAIKVNGELSANYSVVSYTFTSISAEKGLKKQVVKSNSLKAILGLLKGLKAGDVLLFSNVEVANKNAVLGDDVSVVNIGCKLI